MVPLQRKRLRSGIQSKLQDLILITEDNIYLIYTDGACSGNKRGCGIGGYGYVIIDTKENKKYSNSGWVLDTTNNIMELTAAIAALKEISRLLNYKTRETVCAIYSDAKYLVDNWNIHLIKWLDNKWLNSKQENICNKEYWETLFIAVAQFKFVKFDWVKGHSGEKYNEMANDLAVKISQEKKREKAKLSKK